MIRLFVNVDHVATLREARKTIEPEPLTAALLAEAAGADGITVHLREDRRHIQDHDVERIKNGIKTKLNLEMAAVEEMVKIAIKIKPYQVSLVPEKRQEVTTEGGLNVLSQEDKLIKLRDRLKQMGIRLSLFVDPESRQIEAAHRVGADSIEINTGSYTEMKDPASENQELSKIRIAAKYAASLGLSVFAGHGLNNQNVAAVAAISEIEEFNIGHNIVSKAVYVGMERAVKDMIKAIDKGFRQRQNHSTI